MITAIESSGGMAGVSITVSGPQPTAKSAPMKCEENSFINNIEYSNEGMQVWRAYGIGCGKFLSWSNFCQASSSPLSHLNKLADICKFPRFFRKRQSQTTLRENNRNGFRNRERERLMKKTVKKEAGCFTVQSGGGGGGGRGGGGVSQVLPAIFVVRNPPRLWHTEVCPRARNPVQ